ncbi:MAG: hypothetical protein J7L28_02650 [Thermotogae bacterium]|nr:hypothetical protein [Thermotogota bacterium]
MVDLVISIFISTLLMTMLHGKVDPDMLIFAILGGVISHLFTGMRNWRRVLGMVFSLMVNLPKAVFEGFTMVFFRNDETFVIYEKRGLENILKITLTPKSVAVFEDEDGIHSHVLIPRIRRREE